MTLLAFDYGHKKIGVAIGNTISKSARALLTIPTASRDAEILALIREWSPDGFVVGLPVHADGTPHAMTGKARLFGEWLYKRFSKPVVFADERLTTQAAQSWLDEQKIPPKEARQRRDAVAAQIILQAYFDEDIDGFTQS